MASDDLSVMLASLDGSSFLFLSFHLKKGMLPWLSISPLAWQTCHKGSSGGVLANVSTLASSVWIIRDDKTCLREVVFSSLCHFCEARRRIGMMLSGPGWKCITYWCSCSTWFRASSVRRASFATIINRASEVGPDVFLGWFLADAAWAWEIPRTRSTRSLGMPAVTNHQPVT